MGASDKNSAFQSGKAYQIVKQMQATGETLLTIEELEVIDSNNPLSYLATCVLYKQLIKSQQQAIDRGDDGRFYNLECTTCINQHYGILTVELMCTHCNRKGGCYQSQYWKMADGSDTTLPVIHHYQCVSCNKSIEGPYGFWYNCCKSVYLGQPGWWKISSNSNRSAKVINVYNKRNVKEQRASLSLEEKAHEIVEFFNNESDDNGGFRKLQNSLKNNPKCLRDLLKKYESVHFSIVL